jgi:hypothetical protein
MMANLLWLTFAFTITFRARFSSRLALGGALSLGEGVLGSSALLSELFRYPKIVSASSLSDFSETVGLDGREVKRLKV